MRVRLCVCNFNFDLNVGAGSTWRGGGRVDRRGWGGDLKLRLDEGCGCDKRVLVEYDAKVFREGVGLRIGVSRN